MDYNRSPVLVMPDCIPLSYFAIWQGLFIFTLL
nr:MAG TPA: hypothetical protein [Caudoviricetes sp.]